MKLAAMPSRPGGGESGTNLGAKVRWLISSPLCKANRPVKVRFLPLQLACVYFYVLFIG